MALQAPGSFYVNAISSSSISVHWEDVEGADFYKVYMSEIDDFASANIAAMVLSGNEFVIIKDLIPTYPYFVWIQARTEDEFGDLSGSYPVTMPAAPAGALDIEGIQASIWEWATGVVANAGLSDLVIWANQNGTRPQGQHIQLGLAGPDVIGAFDSITAVSGTDQTFQQRGMRSFLVSVNVYSPTPYSATSLAARLQASISNPVLRMPLEAGGLGATKTSDVRDLSAFVETEWENRAQFDFTVFVSLREELVQDVIERVEIQHVIP